MRSGLLTATAVSTVLTVAQIMNGEGTAQPDDTSAEAAAFVAKAEADLAKASEYQNRAQWVQNTYGHLEKLVSIPIARCSRVNVHESERERNGII
jgi:hypothetical protein